MHDLLVTVSYVDWNFRSEGVCSLTEPGITSISYLSLQIFLHYLSTGKCLVDVKFKTFVFANHATSMYIMCLYFDACSLPNTATAIYCITFVA